VSAALVDSAQISFLLDLVILALSALVFSLIFARLKLTIVAGQILAGVVVGPYVLGLVKDPLVLNEVSEIGVVLLFFIIGLELDPAELQKLASKITSLTMLEIAISFAFGLLASYLLGFNSLEALIFSMAASITSTAIVGRIFLAKRVLNRSESGFLIGLLVVEDMIAVGFLIVLSALTSSNVGSFPYFEVGNTSSTIGIFAGLEAVASGLGLILLGYGVARYVAPRVINYLSYYEEEFEEIPFLFALGLGFLFAVIAGLLGYSPGIGAFIIGLSIRGKHSRFLERRITPIKDLFLVLFFVSIGCLINPVPAFSIGWVILLAFALLIIGKFLGGFTVGKVLLSLERNSHVRETLPSPKLFGAWLIPRGEFSLVIGQLGLTLGLVSQGFFSLIGVSVLVAIIAASIIQRGLGPKIAKSDYPFRGQSDDA
jgi:monovalent cation:H+ antiporter-2, CPA2 family